MTGLLIIFIFAAATTTGAIVGTQLGRLARRDFDRRYDD